MLSKVLSVFAIFIAALLLAGATSAAQSTATRPPLPGGDYQPFAADSPFNIPIPANPKLDPKSGKIIATLTGMTQHACAACAPPPHPPASTTRFLSITASHRTRFTPFTATSMARRPTGAIARWRTFGSTSPPMPGPKTAATARTPGARITTSPSSTPPQTRNTTCGARPGPTAKAAISPSVGEVSGPTTSEGINIFGATQSQFALTIGIVRSADINAGIIPHALQMAIPCASGMGVYPAAVPSDEPCPKKTVAPPYYGMRVQLNLSDDEIAALDAPAYAKTIFPALAHYGAFVSDTGTGDSMEFQTESGLTYTRLGLADPWVALASSMASSPTPRCRIHIPHICSPNGKWREHDKVFARDCSLRHRRNLLRGLKDEGRTTNDWTTNNQQLTNPCPLPPSSKSKAASSS